MNSLSAQLVINGDVYIGETGQMHVAVDKTVFISGIVLADRGKESNYGLMSFSAGSTTERADHNTHVNGYVRSYNRNNFFFPPDTTTSFRLFTFGQMPTMRYWTLPAVMYPIPI